VVKRFFPEVGPVAGDEERKEVDQGRALDQLMACKQRFDAGRESEGVLARGALRATPNLSR
jgi:hypothetical protein